MLHIFIAISNIMQWIALYIGAAVLFFYVGRKLRFFHDESDSVFAVIWPVMLAFAVIVSPFALMMHLINQVNTHLSEKEKEDARREPEPEEPFRSAKIAYTARVGEVLMTKQGWDFGWVKAVDYRGRPETVCAKWDAFSSAPGHMPHYCGRHTTWYKTGIFMTESEWISVSRIYTGEEWFSYFRERVV